MAADPHIGRVINRNWRIVRKLGEGGFGTVFEVQHKDVRKLRRAAKQIRSDWAKNEEAARRFRREVNLMAALEGADHIVRVHEFDAEEDFGTFVLMDLVEGPSLAQVIRERGGLPYDLVLKFGRQIASALQRVHEINVVHRDIKAANVLLSLKHEKAYLTDFGIAKELAVAEGEQTIGGAETTGQIQYIGSPRYSCPEQLRIEYPPRPIWDVYSMGAMLYEAFSGRIYLSQLRSYPEFVNKLALDPHYEIVLEYPQAPPASFAALIDHCVRRDPAERLASARELALRLEECEREIATTAVRVRPNDHALARQDLRSGIERRIAALDELEGTLVALDANLPIGPATDTLGQALRDVSVAEDAGDFQEALARLEALQEQVEAAEQRAELAARDAAARRLSELEAARRKLQDDAAIDPRDSPGMEAGLAAARRALAEERWQGLGDDLAVLTRQLETAAATSTVSTERPVPRRRTRAAIVVLAALLLTTGAAVVAWRLTVATGDGQIAGAPARIVSADPTDATVTVDEGATRSFAIDVAPADAEVIWSLGDTVVAQGPGTNHWDYRPDFDAAAAGPYELTARVGDGAAAQTHAWRIRVTDHNRVPVLETTTPPRGEDVRKSFGQTATFTVGVQDPDGDPLQYAWTVDGRGAGTSRPTFDTVVDKESATVAVAVTDSRGGDPLRLEWALKGALAVQPTTLRQIEFGQSQPFKVTPPADATGVQWEVNGARAGDGSTLTFKAADPALVGSGARVLARIARRDRDPLTHEWTFDVKPPRAPRILAANPAGDVVTAPAGATTTLAVTASSPVDGQRFQYVFDIDGTRTTSDSPSIRVGPGEKPRVAVAAIEDNFRQRSNEKRWNVVPAEGTAGPNVDATQAVRQWLDTYASALNRKDVAALCPMLDLADAKCGQLRNALEAQESLKVDFRDLAIEPLADGRLSARYVRVDEFVDSFNVTQTRRTNITQRFRVQDGKAKLERR